MNTCYLRKVICFFLILRVVIYKMTSTTVEKIYPVLIYSTTFIKKNSCDRKIDHILEVIKEAYLS